MKEISSFVITIDIAESGEAAMAMVEKKRYDLIFMDLHLPGIDGWETCKLLRERNLTTPIIGLSADVFNWSKSKLREFGMNDYMIKPIDNAHLVNMLAKYT